MKFQPHGTFFPHSKKHTPSNVYLLALVMRNQTRNKTNPTQQKQVYILYTDLFHVKKYQQGQVQPPKKLISVIMIIEGDFFLFLVN